MKITARKAVDPIIATLLLIAIAVAAGIIVYVYVNSIAGGLTGGGGQQMTDQLQMDAYNYGGATTAPSVTVRNVGSGSITVSQVFFDGQVATVASSSPSGCAAGAPAIGPTTTCQFTLTVPAQSSGTSHIVKILDTAGGTAVMTVIVGRSG